MINVLENIPFKDEGMGKRILADEKHLLMMQVALKPGQAVPQHNANSNVHLLVVRGEVVVNLNGADTAAKEGSLVPIAYKTLMYVKNETADEASFMIIKTPNPSERAGK